ncbi:MAG: biotin--[acetyl-CoA-carboxylase] ligase [Anaerolineae bacterium]|nr:biotin--[acetyl-CoA-carboxylase] ligase [Anaerolineae bacterium]
MTLNAGTLAAALGPRPLRFFPATDSTNDDAAAWLRAGAPAGAVVIADEQRAGRGRLGRVWHTPPGVALAVSLILRPPPAALHRVSMLGGLAVAELCEGLGLPGVGIKYPNDVQLNGRKVCGVLPEAHWQDDRLIGVVLGMGVNVRVPFTPDLAQTAVNLEDAAQRPLEQAALIAALLARLDAWSHRLLSEELFQAWQRRLTTIGQTVSIEGVQGVAIGVEADGALLVQTAAGRVERIIAGDVILL